MTTDNFIQAIQERYGFHNSSIENDLRQYLNKQTNKRREQLLQAVVMGWSIEKKPPGVADLIYLEKKYADKIVKKTNMKCPACEQYRYNGVECKACFFYHTENINETKYFLKTYCYYNKEKDRFFYNELGKEMAKNEVIKFREILKKIELKNRKIKEELERDKIAQDNKLKILTQEKELVNET